MVKNKAAQVLGRLARGKAKTYSAEELERRRVLLCKARAKRWPKAGVSHRGTVGATRNTKPE